MTHVLESMSEQALLGLLLSARRLQQESDDALEQAHRERLSLAPTLDRLLTLLCAHTGALGAAVRTFDEDLELETYSVGEGTWSQLEELWQEDAKPKGATVIQRIDVAGEDFGLAALALPEEPDATRRLVLGELLDVWCEQVDNYLAAIARSRQKHQLTRGLSAALKEPVLDDGIDAAVALLRKEIDFDDLILVFRHEDHGSEVAFKVFRQGQRRYDSERHGLTDEIVNGLFQDRGQQMIVEGDAEVPRQLGLVRYREEVLINGVSRQEVVGRLVVGKAKGDFSTFDRDLLERFADFLRQRIVDFSKEHKRLAQSFNPSHVTRLLREPDYAQRYLVPRDAKVAVMFCDISGFTRISEQVLREPARIGALVDTWGGEAVQAIWDTGGVFDKMVGDCVIGLWGPPFFEWAPSECCAQALDAARAIRALTQQLIHRAELWPGGTLDLPFGVATGLNFCHLFVGRFGPDEDYTGFSSGMNATARLQGLASRDEVFCMEPFVRALGHTRSFGDTQRTNVKNVSEALVYRALTD